MIHRTLHDTLLAASLKSPVISVTGPRQSGKTTLVREVFRDYSYLNFEDMSLREFALDDPASFLKTYGKNLVLDEVQRVPDLFSYLQLAVDEDKTRRIVVTGSQNLLLHHTVSQSLSGRVALFTLLPFSLEELDHASLLHEDYEDYFISGFYPRIYDESLNPEKWLGDYIQTYLERDVRQVSNIIDLHRFQQFIKLCAGHIGQLINLSSYGNALGISYHTVQNWLSVLEASYIIFRLYPYHRNFNKRLVKSPKLYFYDTGLASVLLGLKTKEQAQLHFAKGALFENLVMAEFAKNRYNRGIRPDFYFWRDSIGNEVDLIIDDGNYQRAVEIKSSRVVNPGFFKGLDYWGKLTGAKPDNSFLIYGGQGDQIRVKGKVAGWQTAAREVLS